jgi:hypothetical protein
MVVPEVTVMVTVVECVRAPLVPVTVIENVPMVELEHESVELPEVPRTTELGLSVHDGVPLSLRLTVPVNPPSAVTVIVELAVAPVRAEIDVGFAEIAKSLENRSVIIGAAASLDVNVAKL